MVSITGSEIIKAHDAVNVGVTDIQFTGLKAGTDHTVKITCLVIEELCPGDAYTAVARTKECSGKKL